MNRIKMDLVVIGSGPGGLAAALGAYDLGLKKILIIERESTLGGILPQCIHNGFGLQYFKKELTGPEYAQIFIDKIKNTKIDILPDTMVLDIGRNRTVTISGRDKGIREIEAKSIVLALGCRERTRGAINIPGTRPSGIFTAGLVQKMVNIEGYPPGKEIVILGSGDIGLIMARRLKFEGYDVKGVYEIMPFSTGLKRNIVQCLEDYKIPLKLSHTVARIYGDKRLEAVEVSEVNRNLKPIARKNKKITCDTLLLSVGLIPENELAKTAGIAIDKYSGGPIVDENLHTSADGIFACGNSLYVNDLVDNVTEDGYIAAENAYAYLEGKIKRNSKTSVSAGNNIAYIVPQRISGRSDITFRIRARYPMENAYIKIPEINFTKKTRFVLPGEMLFIKVKEKYFEKINLMNIKSIAVNIEQEK
ncbi:MAG TPA: pyridine nucleotide-disulfide oxidoreductase [Actinobacteria bacterium]|nr:pyridine nucleotide-disulfide oxidoreductase [Actinomycetota bacterium]